MDCHAIFSMILWASLRAIYFHWMARFLFGDLYTRTLPHSSSCLLFACFRPYSPCRSLTSTCAFVASFWKIKGDQHVDPEVQTFILISRHFLDTDSTSSAHDRSECCVGVCVGRAAACRPNPRRIDFSRRLRLVGFLGVCEGD